MSLTSMSQMANMWTGTAVAGRLHQSPLKPDEQTSTVPVNETATVSEFAREQQALDAYVAKRTAANGGVVKDVGHLRPTQPGAFMPFATAEQQKKIDEIGDKYFGNPDFLDLDAMNAELRANGVHYSQLRETAKWFVDGVGAVVDRRGEPVMGARLDIRA